MIRVYGDCAGERYRLFATGHAEKSPTGARVCAAVSALTGALVQFAKGSADCRHLRYYLSEGEVYLSCRGGLQNAFEMVYGALAELALEYPKSLTMEGAYREGKAI